VKARHPIAALIDAFRDRDEDNIAGGVLHIVVDDYNLGDWSISYCRELAEKANDADAIAICDALLAIPVGVDRYVAIGLSRERAEALDAEDKVDQRACEPCVEAITAPFLGRGAKP
jgi:hypothetical protein